ncbi:hypothetical protein CROQUDRAFT_86260 [Cronartium quercuum f. sp. fusiforme G11]|uniref:Uncharacterized protein n=1 Tax=Cronartium quercuum f. sp. fusiforme G11 TaxID=708437 RepID=A0A9P6NRH9_9BASI|nr:hypothetical protein CROQUDRAFT_86260 [Cronartium quercuum f. sp. fusiforme G11]
MTTCAYSPPHPTISVTAAHVARIRGGRWRAVRSGVMGAHLVRDVILVKPLEIVPSSIISTSLLAVHRMRQLDVSHRAAFGYTTTRLPLGKRLLKSLTESFLETPVGYVQKAPEEIGSRFLIRSLSGSRPLLEVVNTSAEAFDSKISTGDFGELLGRLGEGWKRLSVVDFNKQETELLCKQLASLLGTSDTPPITPTPAIVEARNFRKDAMLIFNAEAPNKFGDVEELVKAVQVFEDENNVEFFLTLSEAIRWDWVRSKIALNRK